MIKKKDSYRSCVGIMLLNKKGYIFVGKRFDSSDFSCWQMPQGGINHGERLRSAALRELLEEVGTNKVKILAESKNWIYYDLPKRFIPNYWNGKFLGQKQKWFLMSFYGNDYDININYTDHPEFKDWRWQSLDNLIKNVIFFKKKVYIKIIKEFYSKIIRVSF